MGQLIITEFITLDGVVDSPGGGPHPHAGWTFRHVAFDEAAYEIKDREQQEATAMLMGRISYEEFAPVWPSMEEFTEYNAMPKYVVSSTLQNPQWHNTSVLGSLDEVARLKETVDGTILVHGSATLVRGLLEARLIDDLRLMIFPVLVGGGKGIFPGSFEKSTFTLVESETVLPNVVALTYSRTA